MGNYENIPDIDGMENDVPKTSGMKVLRNVFDLESCTTGNIIIRSITECFWGKVIEATKTHRVCALGTPGIGKSTTICILIRLLLKQNKKVVYRIRNGGFVYMFTPEIPGDASKQNISPNQNEEASVLKSTPQKITLSRLGEIKPIPVDVKVIEENKFSCWARNINREDIYYVVDPSESTDNCNLGMRYLGKKIIVASPNEGHWGKSGFFKGRGFPAPQCVGKEFDEGHYVEGELDRNDEGLNREDIFDEECYIEGEHDTNDKEHVGEKEFDEGRHIKGELDATVPKRGIQQGLFLFYPTWTLSELLASWFYITNGYKLNDLTVKDRFFKFGGVPRYIFTSAVEGYEKEQNRALSNLNFETAMDFAKIDRNAIETLSEKSSRGILLSFILSENDEGSFENAHATLSSDLIYEKFTNRYMGMLWEQIVPNFGKFDPYLFAMYCAVMLCDRNEQKKLAFTTRKMTGQNRDSIELTRCSTREKVHNIIEAARLDEKILFLPISPTYELIDFAYRDGNTYHCFQCTIGLKHTQNPKHIYQLLLNVYNNEEINLLASMTEEELPRVKLYYAVPAFRFDVFSSKHPNAMAEAKEYCIHKNENNSLFYYWDKLVSIDILSIDRPNSKEPTKLVEEAKPQDLITSTLSMHQIYGCLDTMPGLYGQLLSFKKDEQIDGLIKSFKIDKLKVCLRCLSLKPKGN